MFPSQDSPAAPVALRRRASRLRRTAAALAASALVLSLPPAGAQRPSDGDRTKAAAGRQSERLRALQREAEDLAAEGRTLLAELRKLELERQASIERLAQIERQRKEVEQELEAAEARAAELAASAEAELPEIEARLVHLYKLGRVGYWRLILNSADVRALGRAYRTASALAAIDRTRIADHYERLDALAAERKVLQARADELAALRDEAAAARAALDKAVSGRAALITEIDARRDLTAQLIGELQAADERLRATISRIESDRPPPGGRPLRALQGELPWPARGPVARPFGSQPGGAGATVVRNGMEIVVAEGQPVRSVHEGTVAFADAFTGFGNLAILEHGGGSYSLYGYLESLDVARGRRLPAGATIGRSGRNPTGNPALYFELRIDGSAVDPLQWLVKTP